ncbi:hypothetical protein BDV37DRAFT_277200 [Aspergillus pseudonomiae]|uniref:RRM domain-containing protein n=1 Tax=Aspergillus pseudonomiae TaxID=1506151 RepID=A0A5N7CSY3_9EURO|nr:uncharacterized protein BDV37DRAFT_277200 [Aspergillus pseudonomiae]KAE8397059.1 hypothetical protein BDV37DRAFT_277200 [Aspergillus pseudonomiae]
MPQPQKGKSRPRGSDEEFVLFLQGIPAHCRWQELKDLVRQTALHIRQAVVYDDHHGFPTGLGQIIVKNEDEAWRTYPGTSPTYPPPEYGHAPVMSFMPIYPDPLSQHMPGIPPSPSFCDPLAFTVYPPYPVSPMPAFQDLSHHRTPHKPPYSYTYSYTPTPIPFYAPHPQSNGNLRTSPRRTIFIQNLSPTTTQSDLHSHLQDAGTIESCEVPLDPATARCKGFARITFRTADEAKRAVARYNNSIILNAKIRVKIDRAVPFAASYALTPPSTVPVTIVSSAPPTTTTTAYTPEHTPTTEEPPQTKSRPGPLVVNGSGIGRNEITT